MERLAARVDVYRALVARIVAHHSDPPKDLESIADLVERETRPSDSGTVAASSRPLGASVAEFP